jgi:hypothetical protein
MTPEEAIEAGRVAHAQANPDGCAPHGCDACIERLGILTTPCPVCGRPLHPVRGTMPPHAAYRAKGRPGYSRRHMQQFVEDCRGSGRSP